MKREVYELQPVDSRKSFYRKAFVEIVGNFKTLKSYDTIVAVINEAGKIFRTWDDWSQTTGRHIAAFTESITGKKLSKSEWDKMPVYDWNEEAGTIAL